ncbi:capsid protein [Lactococcus lactis]|uniref:capsid protein n=1 Tax=Lactococcus lactis TaxID=1358 RepID=UPI0025A236C7|nr:capsid protein [Lactococcus lactis]MDM7533509.1 capsid protein [Lactococcus lactis]
MALNLNYGDRKIFWGDEGLLIATLDATSGKPTAKNIQLATGMVSVSSMEDKAEVSNYPADNKPNHGSKKGATLLEGEMVFMQIDEPVGETLLGQVKSENGLGWVPTGVYTEHIVQYVNKAQKHTAKGEVINGYKIVVYPALKATGEGTFEAETDSSDGVDPIQYTIPLQATETPKYKSKGNTPAQMTYEVWGKQAEEFEKMMEKQLFIMFPDTVIAESSTAV